MPLDAGARPPGDQERDVVVLVPVLRPGAVDVDRADDPDAVRELAVVVAGREDDVAERGEGPALNAVRGGDEQVLARAVYHARRAEVPDQLAVGLGEQRSDRGRPVEHDRDAELDPDGRTADRL